MKTAFVFLVFLALASYAADRVVTWEYFTQTG